MDVGTPATVLVDAHGGPMRSLLAFLTLATAASADELTLRNGSTFIGVVQARGDKVTIETDYGSITFKKIDVKSIVKGRDPIGEFDARIQAECSTQELAALAAWAVDQGLHGRAQWVYRMILAREPEHADARRGLGFEKVGGRWLTGDDLQIARGMVKFEGRWISREEAARLREEAAARDEADRLEAERRRVVQSPPPPPQEQEIPPQDGGPQSVEGEPPMQSEPVEVPYDAPQVCQPSVAPPAAPVSVRPPLSPRSTIFSTPPLRITPRPLTSPHAIVVRPWRIATK
jgi:hypothetical protein